MAVKINLKNSPATDSEKYGKVKREGNDIFDDEFAELNNQQIANNFMPQVLNQSGNPDFDSGTVSFIYTNSTVDDRSKDKPGEFSPNISFPKTFSIDNPNLEEEAAETVVSSSHSGGFGTDLEDVDSFKYTETTASTTIKQKYIGN